MATIMRLEMLKKDLTVAQMARAIGMDTGNLSAMSTGKRSCSLRLRGKIAEKLDLPEEYLFDSLGRAVLYEESKDNPFVDMNTALRIKSVKSLWHSMKEMPMPDEDLLIEFLDPEIPDFITGEPSKSYSIGNFDVDEEAIIPDYSVQPCKFNEDVEMSRWCYLEDDIFDAIVERDRYKAALEKIAHAPQDIADLVEMVEELKTENDALKRIIKGYQMTGHCSWVSTNKEG